MVTERLYFHDPYLRQFEARILARSGQPDCQRVALDQSAFYPEGGGQPADSGTLAGIRVRDVQIDDQDVVWHTLDQQPEHDTVMGLIDWERRFDHMQQHHGQHLLSAAFEQLFGIKTVAFHLGETAATIDLATPLLTTEQANVTEELTNRVIWESRPILARFVDAAELATIQLRKPPTVSGPIRVVSVPEFDHSACGGTHPRTTSEVGILHLRRWDRRGETTRVEFLCGGRALRDLRWKSAALTRMAQQLSVAPTEVDLALTRLREAEERARKGLDDARGQLLIHEVAQHIAMSQTVGHYPIVRILSEERSLDELRTLARLIADRGCIALIGMGGEKGHLIFARGSGLTTDCSALLRTILAPLGGRGGGRPELAQGGIPNPTLVAGALDQALTRLRDQPTPLM